MAPTAPRMLRATFSIFLALCHSASGFGCRLLHRETITSLFGCPSYPVAEKTRPGGLKVILSKLLEVSWGFHEMFSLGVVKVCLQLLKVNEVNCPRFNSKTTSTLGHKVIAREAAWQPGNHAILALDMKFTNQKSHSTQDPAIRDRQQESPPSA